MHFIRDKKSLASAPILLIDVLDGVQNLFNSRKAWSQIIGPVALQFITSDKNGIDDLFDNFIYQRVRVVRVLGKSGDSGFDPHHLASALPTYDDSGEHTITLNLDLLAYSETNERTESYFVFVLWTKIVHELIHCCTPAINEWCNLLVDTPTSSHIRTMYAGTTQESGITKFLHNAASYTHLIDYVCFR